MRIIWSIARLVLLQSLRRRVAAATLVVFLLSLPLLLIKADPDAAREGGRRLRIEADGTQTGEVKILLIYGLGLASILTLASTLFLSCSALDEEFVEQQVHLVVAKPVRRWQILLGKWAGVMLLNGWLLLLMGTVLLLLVAWFARPDPARPEGYLRVRQEVLTCRRSVRPDDLDMEAAVRRVRRSMLAQGVPPEEIDEKAMRFSFRNQIEKKHMRVPPYGVTGFYLDDVPRATDPHTTEYTVRFRLHALDESRAPILGRWTVGRSDGEYMFMRETKSTPGHTRYFRVPARVVGPDGVVFIRFQNITPGNPRRGPAAWRAGRAVSFNMKSGLELLAPVSSDFGRFLGRVLPFDWTQSLDRMIPFLLNYARGMLLLFLRLGLVAMVGVAATAELRFSVAILVGFLVIYLGFMNEFYVGFLQKQGGAFTEAKLKNLSFQPGEIATDSGVWAYERVLKPAATTVLSALAAAAPSFAKTDPAEHLAAGRIIPWSTVGARILYDIFLRGGLIFLFGCWLFRRREVARPEI